MAANTGSDTREKLGVMERFDSLVTDARVAIMADARSVPDTTALLNALQRFKEAQWVQGVPNERALEEALRLKFRFNARRVYGTGPVPLSHLFQFQLPPTCRQVTEALALPLQQVVRMTMDQAADKFTSVGRREISQMLVLHGLRFNMSPWELVEAFDFNSLGRL